MIRGDKEPSIVDLKTGRLVDSIGTKLAGYKDLWNGMTRKKGSPYYGMKKVKRCIAVGVHRDDEGNVKIKEYGRKKDEENWERAKKEYREVVRR